MPATKKPLFALGQVVATPGALQALASNGQTPAEFIGRHVNMEQGALCAEDHALNKQDLKDGNRLLSSFLMADGETKVWVITECDRSSTCVLLPSEY